MAHESSFRSNGFALTGRTFWGFEEFPPQGFASRLYYAIAPSKPFQTAACLGTDDSRWDWLIAESISSASVTGTSAGEKSTAAADGIYAAFCSPSSDY